MCNRVWKGEGWPEEWKKGVIPTVKKGIRERVTERGLQRDDADAIGV